MPDARRPARPRGGPAGGPPTGVTPARAAAADVLADLRAGQLLDPAFERRAARLDPRDRRWTQELVYGLLRRRAWVDAVLEARVRGGLVSLDPTSWTSCGSACSSSCGWGACPRTRPSTRRGAGQAASRPRRRLARQRRAAARRPRARAGVDALDPPGRRTRSRRSPSPLAPALARARWAERWDASEVERLLAANNVEAPVVARPVGVDVGALRAALDAEGVATDEAPEGAVWPMASSAPRARRALTELDGAARAVP
jgi:16S rRNA (cytosine967-C5)-methyltransferase